MTRTVPTATSQLRIDRIARMWHFALLRPPPPTATVELRIDQEERGWHFALSRARRPLVPYYCSSIARRLLHGAASTLCTFAASLVRAAFRQLSGVLRRRRLRQLKTRISTFLRLLSDGRRTGRAAGMRTTRGVEHSLKQDFRAVANIKKIASYLDREIRAALSYFKDELTQKERRRATLLASRAVRPELPFFVDMYRVITGQLQPRVGATKHDLFYIDLVRNVYDLLWLFFQPGMLGYSYLTGLIRTVLSAARGENPDIPFIENIYCAISDSLQPEKHATPVQREMLYYMRAYLDLQWLLLYPSMLCFSWVTALIHWVTPTDEHVATLVADLRHSFRALTRTVASVKTTLLRRVASPAPNVRISRQEQRRAKLAERRKAARHPATLPSYSALLRAAAADFSTAALPLFRSTWRIVSSFFTKVAHGVRSFMLVTREAARASLVHGARVAYIGIAPLRRVLRAARTWIWHRPDPLIDEWIPPSVQRWLTMRATQRVNRKGAKLIAGILQRRLKATIHAATQPGACCCDVTTTHCLNVLDGAAPLTECCCAKGTRIASPTDS